MCGGSIINSHWIVTANHCLDIIEKDYNKNKIDEYYYKLVVGTTKISYDTSYEISKIVQRPHRRDPPGDNDIGLIKVEKDIVFGERVKPIEIGQDHTAPNVQALISGWSVFTIG